MIPFQSNYSSECQHLADKLPKPGIHPFNIIWKDAGKSPWQNPKQPPNGDFLLSSARRDFRSG
jgi:hypothetical protein